MAAVRVAPYSERLERLRKCVPREGRNWAWQPVAVWPPEPLGGGTGDSIVWRRCERTQGSVIFAEHYFNVSLRAPRDCGVPVFDRSLLP